MQSAQILYRFVGIASNGNPMERKQNKSKYVRFFLPMMLFQLKELVE